MKEHGRRHVIQGSDVMLGPQQNLGHKIYLLIYLLIYL